MGVNRRRSRSIPTRVRAASHRDGRPGTAEQATAAGAGSGQREQLRPARDDSGRRWASPAGGDRPDRRRQSGPAEAGPAGGDGPGRRRQARPAEAGPAAADELQKAHGAPGCSWRAVQVVVEPCGEPGRWALLAAVTPPAGTRVGSAPLLGGLRRPPAGLAVPATGRGCLGRRLTAARGPALAALGADSRAGVAVGGRGGVGQRCRTLRLLQADDLRTGAEGGRRTVLAGGRVPGRRRLGELDPGGPVGGDGAASGLPTTKKSLNLPVRSRMSTPKRMPVPTLPPR